MGMEQERVVWNNPSSWDLPYQLAERQRVALDEWRLWINGDWIAAILNCCWRSFNPTWVLDRQLLFISFLHITFERRTDDRMPNPAPETPQWINLTMAHMDHADTAYCLLLIAVSQTCKNSLWPLLNDS